MAHLEQHAYGGIGIECIVEAEPLGTGGALRNVRDRLTSDPVLVMNGDTMVDVSLASFLAAHEASDCEVSMVCLAVDDLAAFGALALDARGRVHGHHHAGGAGPVGPRAERPRAACRS